MIRSVAGFEPMQPLPTTRINQQNKGPVSYHLSHPDLSTFYQDFSSSYLIIVLFDAFELLIMHSEHKFLTFIISNLSEWCKFSKIY